jgi:beta-galactosidase
MLACLLLLAGVVNAQRRINLDVNWRFKLHDAADAKPTPAAPCSLPQCTAQYDDSQWRVLNLPHDFVVEGDFTPKADKSHGYLPYAAGWYRLHFTLQTEIENQVISWIDFDGTQRDATAWLNGQLLGHHSSGYTSYRFNASDLLKIGVENVLTLFVDATQPDSWWYDGGGIYRSVWLNLVSPLHIVPWSVYVPSVVDNSTIVRRIQVQENGQVRAAPVADAVLHHFVDVQNLFSTDMAFSVRWTLLGPDGKVVTSFTQDSLKLVAFAQATISGQVELKDVLLWDIDHPILYSIICEVLVGTSVIDFEKTTIGFRHFYFDRDQGFFVNNLPRKIKGMANHQDFAGIGVAVPDALQRYRVLKLKEMGANAWRTAHNPPNPALLDECDRQGFFVWDENHRNIYDGDWISDLESLILRDRNHPSIILWSLCNEVLCMNFNASSASQLKALVKKLDPLGGRLVTAAMNGGYDGDFPPVLDLIGINYNIGEYDHCHQKYNTQPIIGSETASTVSDRGIYADDPVRAYVQAYDRDYPGWAATAETAWKGVATRDFVSGSFCWTGFDYKGEPTPYAWPNINSHFGVIDICGFPKDLFFYYQSVWVSEPMIHVLPHWNWESQRCSGLCMVQDDNSSLVNVWVFTNADEVELFLNGKSLGKKSMPQTVSPMGYVWRGHVEWNVTYAPGTLSAVGYKNGQSSVYVKEEIVTADVASAIQLEKEFPSDGQGNIVLVTVRAVDSNGVLNPIATDSINFQLTGPAKILGVGNGDPSSHESDKPALPQEGVRSVWNGLARVVVEIEGEGEVVLSADSCNLAGTKLSLN